MGRKLNDFLSGYIKFTETSESPISFHTWAGISCVAASLQRRVYMHWGHTTIYPNQFIVLVGPSGQVRKGEPIVLAREFAESIKIPLIGEDNSVEAIIRAMSESVTNFTDHTTGKLRFQCAVSCFVEELAVLAGQQNSTLLAYLTNWYDSRDKWKRTTKHQGTDEIHGMCFNLLAATAPDWLPYILPQEAIGGGFTSRCIFVVEEAKSKIIANPNLHPPNRKLQKELEHDLELINLLSGEFEFDNKALEQYVKWYEHEEGRNKNGKATISDPMLAGYNSRRATHVKKIAMSMSASRGDDMVISERDFLRALTLLEAAERKMSRVFTGIGKPRYLEETEVILNYLIKKGSASKSELLRVFFRTLDNASLDSATQVLVSMKVVNVVRDTGKNETWYKFTGPRSPEGAHKLLIPPSGTPTLEG